MKRALAFFFQALDYFEVTALNKSRLLDGLTCKMDNTLQNDLYLIVYQREHDVAMNRVVCVVKQERLEAPLLVNHRN